jgi:hypothetical protein
MLLRSPGDHVASSDQPIAGLGQARWIRGSPEEVMNWWISFAALFVMLALAGCAQGGTGLAGAQYAPYSPENNGNMRDSGGGGGGGGGM